MQTPATKPKEVIPDRIKKQIYLGWGAAIAITLISTIYYFCSQPQLPLFYSLATKNDQLANKEFLFIFPGLSFLMNFVHIVVIRTLKKYSSLMLKLFAVTTTILQLIFLLALVRIVLITI